MTDTIPVPSSVASSAHVDKETYDKMYAASTEAPEAFWAEEGRRIDWIKPFSKVNNLPAYAVMSEHDK